MPATAKVRAMPDLDRLLDEFVAEHRAGADPDPRRFLAGLEGADRAELESLFDAYLARAPRREWDPDAFAASPARDVADSLARSLGGAAGAWPVLLPNLRARARLRRDEVVSRLADALGVADRTAKVADYYHRMEQGTLPAAGVSERALEALGAIFDTGAAALRRAGEAVGPPPAGEAASAVFARRASGEPAAEEPGREPPAAPPPAAERDEVDELFTRG